MRRLVILTLVLAASTALGTAAWGLQQPGRTFARDGQITSIALTHGSVAFSVGRTKTDCDHVELWNTDTRGTWRFGRAHPCGDLPLFSGIGPIGVATNRVVWVSFAGGNHTDWELWTATPTRKAPRRLAFVERDTSEAPAMVVGPGTPQAVPYAVGANLTLLAENGAPAFRWAAPSEVRALTAGSGPHGWRVAALLDDGSVTVLNGAGSVGATFEFPPGQVKWVGLAPVGLLVQLPGAKVEIRNGAATKTVQLKPNAIVLDYAEGRILYRVGQAFWMRRVANGADVQVLQGSRAHRIFATLDTHGLAWAQDTKVAWVCAGCIVP
jgi:hypothetical protein